ncbi:hypothetical protein AAG906_008939 [Vitis piasezkii]
MGVKRKHRIIKKLYSRSIVRVALEVWFANIKRVGIPNYLVVALDDDIENFCKSNNVLVYKRDPDEGIDSVVRIGGNHAISGLMFWILGQFLLVHWQPDLAHEIYDILDPSFTSLLWNHKWVVSSLMIFSIGRTTVSGLNLTLISSNYVIVPKPEKTSRVEDNLFNTYLTFQVIKCGRGLESFSPFLR